MNKDESLHRLLRRTSRPRADARPQGACLDAETLAAWTSGSLTASERAAAETHAASCERCLDVLAAIAKTSPPPTEMPRPAWFSIRWLVPVTTAAAAITVWVLVTGPLNTEAPTPTPPAIVTNTGAPADRPPQELKAEPGARTRADAFEKKVASPPPRGSADRAESRRSATSNARKSGAISNKARAPAETIKPVAELPSTTPAPSAAAAPPASPPTRAEASDERLQRRFRTVVPWSGVILSPDPKMRWRVVGRSVERSTDGGLTWRSQSTGTDVDWLAGSSPGAAVCWIVGRNGTVILSVDGETWRRIDFPDTTIDLVGVTARDGVAAAVNAADGRTYATTDGGRTWTLQENAATPF